ncbi:hypothetical protein [Wolbachia pipientis]|nr:hypothetical protein [Wolbachia pipientis]
MSTVEKILLEDTPIAMLWVVKDPMQLKYDKLPLPNISILIKIDY